MTKVTRVPNGYRNRLVPHKRKLKELVFDIDNLKNAGGYQQSVDTKLSALSMHLPISGRYVDDNEVLHLGFSTDLVTAEVLVTKSGRFSLSKTCTCYIAELDSYVENYKW